MTRQSVIHRVDRMLGVLGLFLLLVLARLAGPAYRPQQHGVARLTGFAARRAIDAIAVVGWMVDRLPLPRDPRSKSALRTDQRSPTIGPKRTRPRTDPQDNLLAWSSFPSSTRSVRR